MGEEHTDEKAPKMTKIVVIDTRGESALVEWQEKGIAKRGFVQVDSIDGDRALPDVLAYALPVGPDPTTLDVRKLTKALRSRDVWTLADFVQKRNAVVKSLLEAMED